MAISFTKSIVDRLNKEIAEIHIKSDNEKKKAEKALSKINQLQKDMELSTSAHDLSSKMSRISKLKANIQQINFLQADLSQQLVTKTAILNQQPQVQ
ncbi:seryl-tRNA synthetase [Paenibacillus sp. DS2015]|uniref:hypothetical protein n=1 Tax=Paenibacillus sp. DS2015 TaxID=3373917 RepID=UPI003D1AA9EE